MVDAAPARDRLAAAITAVYGRLKAGRLEAGDVVTGEALIPDTPPRYIRHVLAERSVYEDDARILARLPAAMGTILDIGAHWGYMAASFRHAGAQGPILSFEPMRAHHRCLDELRRRDPLYDFAPIGLSDSPHSVTLYGPVVNGKPIMGLNSVDGAIFNEHHRAHLVSLVGGEIEVAPSYRFQLHACNLLVERLDDVLARRRFYVLSPFRVETKRIAAIKLDVEGHEPNVLRGAEATLVSHRPFIMIESGNRNPAVSALLQALGYVYGERNGTMLVRTDTHSTAPNGFWMHGERLDEYRALELL
jgi:FkbM family methyltransferase